MTARITPTEARRLGIDVPPTRARTTRRVAKGAKYHTVCKSCRTQFTTEAAEERHVPAARHYRFELVL